MIKLTALNNNPFYINPQQIASIHPRTSGCFIALLNNEEYQVEESPERVIELIEASSPLIEALDLLKAFLEVDEYEPTEEVDRESW